MPWCWSPSKMARLPHTLVFRSFSEWRRDLVGWLCSVSQHEVSELPSLRHHLIQHPLFCLLIMQPKGVAPQLEIQTGAFLPTPWLYHIITFLGWAGTRPVQQTPHTHPLSLFSVTSGAMRASHGTPRRGWGGRIHWYTGLRKFFHLVCQSKGQMAWKKKGRDERRSGAPFPPPKKKAARRSQHYNANFKP